MRARTNATCRRDCLLSAVDRFGGNRVRYSCVNAGATVTSYYYTGTRCEEGGRTTTTTTAANDLVAYNTCDTGDIASRANSKRRRRRTIENRTTVTGEQNECQYNGRSPKRRRDAYSRLVVKHKTVYGLLLQLPNAACTKS